MFAVKFSLFCFSLLSLRMTLAVNQTASSTNSKVTLCHQRADDIIPSSVHECCRWKTLCRCLETLAPPTESEVITCQTQEDDPTYPCVEYIISHQWVGACPLIPSENILLENNSDVASLKAEVAKERAARRKVLVWSIVIGVIFGCTFLLTLYFCFGKSGSVGLNTTKKKRKNKGELQDKTTKQKRRTVASNNQVTSRGVFGSTSKQNLKASKGASKRLMKSRDQVTSSSVAISSTTSGRNRGSDDDGKKSEPAQPAILVRNSFNSRAVQTQMGFSKADPNRSMLSKKVNLDQLKKFVQ